MTKSGKNCGKRRNNIFKEPSAAEVSESVYMRERVKLRFQQSSAVDAFSPFLKLKVKLLNRVKRHCRKTRKCLKLIISNFSFSHNVFKSRLQQKCQNDTECGKQIIITGYMHFVLTFPTCRRFLTDECAADDFWKHCGKRRNCSSYSIQWWNFK